MGVVSAEAPRDGISRVEIGNSVFDPLTEAFTRDPFPTWLRLVSECPVAWHVNLRQWIVCSHELAYEVLKSAGFSRSNLDLGCPRSQKPAGTITNLDRLVEHAFLHVDAATHSRLRKLCTPAFKYLTTFAVFEQIRDVVRQAFDEIADPAEFDVHSDLASKIPARVVARIVGLPPESNELLQQSLATALGRAGNPLLKPHVRWRAAQEILPGLAYLEEAVSARRRRGDRHDDLLDVLLQTEISGDKLSDWDIIATVASLFAGDSAIDLHTYSVMSLLGHADQYRMVMEGRVAFESAILEVARHGAFFRTGVPRVAIRDAQLGGQDVARGESILIVLSAAWNDPAKWPNPRRFDVSRCQTGNLIFGAGPHFCIGLGLAKLQVRAAIEELNRRFPKARVSSEPHYDYTHYNARRIDSLRVRTA